MNITVYAEHFLKVQVLLNCTFQINFRILQREIPDQDSHPQNKTRSDFKKEVLPKMSKYFSSNAKLCMLNTYRCTRNRITNFRLIFNELYLCLASLPFMSLFLPGSPHGALISIFKCDKSRTYRSQIFFYKKLTREKNRTEGEANLGKLFYRIPIAVRSHHLETDRIHLLDSPFWENIESSSCLRLKN